MDFTEIKGWMDFTKGAVDLLKSASSMLPKGEKRDEIEGKINAAEDALKRSDVKLARELGLKLCDCTFPPQIMLWKEIEKAHACPNPSCGRRKKPGMQISREALDAISQPSGRNNWMAK